MKTFVKIQPDVTAIARHLKITKAYVSLILSGKRKGGKYRDRVLELAGKRKAA